MRILHRIARLIPKRNCKVPNITTRYAVFEDSDDILDLDSKLGPNAMPPHVLLGILGANDPDLSRVVALVDDEIVGYIIYHSTLEQVSILRVAVIGRSYSDQIATKLFDAVKQTSWNLAGRIVAHVEPGRSDILNLMAANGFSKMNMDEDGLIPMECPCDDGGQVIHEILYGESKVTK